MRLFTVFLTVLLMLTACAAPVQPTTVPADTATPESQAVISDGTLQTSLLATLWKNNSEGQVLLPFDPATGTALPGYTPISLGQSSFPAFSPNRKTLAVVSFPGDGTYHGNLLVIDLPTWKTRRFELELAGWVSTMVFSPDGKRLAVAHGESNYTLTMIDVEKGVITAQSKTTGFVPRLKFTESSDALMLYSSGGDDRLKVSAGPPQILLLDAADLSPRWSATLDNVHDGVFAKDETITQSQLYEPGNAMYLSPGLAFAPDRDVLYIVHADSEQLTTVDFGAQKVETVEIQAKLSWFERLLSLTADVAHAKVADGTSKQIGVSPDGQFLYVVGVKNASSQDQQGNWEYNQTPLGLEIIQASDGTRVEHFETDATELSLSPDGRFLYLKNWMDTAPWTEIFDTAARKIVARKESFYATPVLLMNGQLLLASTYVSPDQENHMSVRQASDLSVMSDWTGSEFIYWLPTP